MMGNIFDYLTWRGDLTFTQDPPNAVDALIFSTLTYVGYGKTAERLPETAATLRAALRNSFRWKTRRVGCGRKRIWSFFAVPRQRYASVSADCACIRAVFCRSRKPSSPP